MTCFYSLIAPDLMMGECGIGRKKLIFTININFLRPLQIIKSLGNWGSIVKTQSTTFLFCITGVIKRALLFPYILQTIVGAPTCIYVYYYVYNTCLCYVLLHTIMVTWHSIFTTLKSV